MEQGLSNIKYIADGNTNTFGIPFPYLSKNDLIVTIDGEAIFPVSFPTEGQVTVPNIPPTDSIVEISRHTSFESLVEFKNVSILNAETLNTNSKQLLYLIQEMKNASSLNVNVFTSSINQLFSLNQELEETFLKQLSELDQEVGEAFLKLTGFEKSSIFLNPYMTIDEINQIIADAPEYTTIVFKEGEYTFPEVYVNSEGYTITHSIKIINKKNLSFIGEGNVEIVYTENNYGNGFVYIENSENISFQNLKMSLVDNVNKYISLKDCTIVQEFYFRCSFLSVENCQFQEKFHGDGKNVTIKDSQTRDLSFYTATEGYYSLDNVRVVGDLHLYGDETDSGKPYINNSHISHFFSAYETPNLTIKGTFFNDKSFLSSQKNLQISDCIFQDNSQDFYLEGTDTNLVDCYFRSKSSRFYGIYEGSGVTSGNMVIDNCIFEGGITSYSPNTLYKNSSFKGRTVLQDSPGTKLINNNFKTLSVNGGSSNVSVINNNISEKLNVTQGATNCFILGNKITSAETALNLTTSNCKVSDNFISGDADIVVSMSYTSNSLITNNKISGGGLETSGISKCVIQGNDVNTIIDNSGSSHEVPTDGNYYLGNRVDSITLLADDGYTNHSKIGDNFITSEM